MLASDEHVDGAVRACCFHSVESFPSQGCEHLAFQMLKIQTKKERLQNVKILQDFLLVFLEFEVVPGTLPSSWVGLEAHQVKCQKPQLMATIFSYFCNDVPASSKVL